MYNSITNKLAEDGLWASDRTHNIAASPFKLTNDQLETLEKLGPAILSFYNAVNDLYLHSGNDWVNDYLDIGKPESILKTARMKFQKKALPRVIRPDILIGNDGLIITELDSIPGGIGHLDCLSSAYSESGFELIKPARQMRDSFAEAMMSAADNADPVCAIVVSEESADYFPEMDYLASQLRKTNFRAYAVSPKEVTFTEDGLFIETENGKLKIDVLYRFYELFDLPNVPKSELFTYAAKRKVVVITPPLKHFTEEKMLIALLHLEVLKDFWQNSMGKDNFRLLHSLTSPTYIMDNHPIPPNAQISGFRWNDKPIRDWMEIANGSQKQRELVLKPSGFSELAWGSRGVKIGHDLPAEEWSDAVKHSLESFNVSPYVLQPFYNTKVTDVDYFDKISGKIKKMNGRVRLCAYYFVVNDNTELAGALATVCPQNKKIIHGMVDAVIMPCYKG
jgi:hypothetical protein